MTREQKAGPCAEKGWTEQIRECGRGQWGEGGNKLEQSTKPQSMKRTVIPVTMYANFNTGNKREGRKGEL